MDRPEPEMLDDETMDELWRAIKTVCDEAGMPAPDEVHRCLWFMAMGAIESFADDEAKFVKNWHTHCTHEKAAFVMRLFNDTCRTYAHALYHIECLEAAASQKGTAQ